MPAERRAMPPPAPNMASAMRMPSVQSIPRAEPYPRVKPQVANPWRTSALSSNTFPNRPHAGSPPVTLYRRPDDYVLPDRKKLVDIVPEDLESNPDLLVGEPDRANGATICAREAPTLEIFLGVVSKLLPDEVSLEQFCQAMDDSKLSHTARLVAMASMQVPAGQWTTFDDLCNYLLLPAMSKRNIDLSFRKLGQMEPLSDWFPLHRVLTNSITMGEHLPDLSPNARREILKDEGVRLGTTGQVVGKSYAGFVGGSAWLTERGFRVQHW